MRKKRTAALILIAVVVGTAAGAGQKGSFQTARTQAIDLHRSLIVYAAPPVKAKITASALAARDYLAKCGRSCDLHAFLAKDLKRRFPRTNGDEVRLLEALVFAETVGDMSQMDQLDLQNAMEKKAQLLQLISNISKMAHDTLKAIIQNMRG
jgi:hypothetical protein